MANFARTVTRNCVRLVYSKPDRACRDLLEVCKVLQYH
jgi:hypothetical protein